MKTFEVTQDYNRENFLEFLSDFLPEDYTQEEEQTYFDYTNIEDGYKLGTCDSLDLDVFEFRTKSERDPRVTLTREVVSFMKKYGANQNALVVFYSDESHNWRLSLITTDYEVINGKVKPLYSNPRRFSFRLGGECKAHTPKVMLFKKGKICEHTENGKTITPIEDLKSRFALEVVSKQFFDEYKVFYEDFVQYITGNRYVKAGGKGKYERKTVSKENTKIFNQFKKLANDDYELACKYVRDYIKKFMGRLVFLQFLQKKGWLGVAQNESWGNGNKNFLLDLFTSSNYKKDFLEKVLEPLFFGMLNTDIDDRKKLFKEKEWDVALLDEFMQIPYLNGGLFEDDVLDHLEIKFPQEMFSNPAKADKERTFNDKKDYSKEPYPFTESCGLLDFFARYNFTIDETDPADMEIGVEPEMLGKIFENLLEDNKDKGAFYTPKEIVQYMCRESLIAYLGDNEKVRSLVTSHVAEFNDSEKSELIKNLKAVKVCDPAVGSGAFPMGILNELFACRIALGENEESAEIKKQIVRENIYGVDIEKGAVDIARLRFWLAIIVDEKEPIPLPNLDYKIMQGNSLLECYEGIDLSTLTQTSGGLFDNDEIIQQLKDAIDGFYIPSDHIAKAKIRKQIGEKVIQLLKERQLPPKAIKELESVDLHSNSDFFLWHTWFGDVFNRPNDCNGFDIVIGNPPYVFARDSKEKGITPELKKNYYKNFELAKYQLNLYHLFIEQGTKLLNKGGIFSYIVPNNWLTINTNKELRRFVLEKSNIQIINFYKKVFENADVDSSIIIFRNDKQKDGKVKLFEATHKEHIDLIKESNCTFFLNQKDFIINIELFKNNSFAQILNKIENSSRELKEIADVKAGLCAYEVGAGTPPQTKEMKINRIYHSLKKESNDYYKYLDGNDVKRYEITWERKEFLKYGKNLAAPRNNFDLYSTPRILVRQIPSKLPYCINACYTEETILNDRNSMNIIYIKENPKFVLGVLNSKAISFWFAHKFGKLQRGLFPQFKINELAIFPIPIANSTQKQEIIMFVEKILEAKHITPTADTSRFENLIDEKIFDLYDLSPEERKIINS